MRVSALQAYRLRRSPLGWNRAVALAFAILFIIVGAWSALINLMRPSGMDFLDFWAAGRLVLQGHPELAYDITIHGAVENTIAHIGGRMPFPYPPPFLAIVAPFALLPYGIAMTFGSPLRRLSMPSLRRAGLRLLTRLALAPR